MPLKSKTRLRSYFHFGLGILAISLFLVLWQWISSAEFISSALFPPPTKVVTALLEMASSGELLTDTKASLWRALAGFVMGSVTGIVVGLFTGRSFLANSLLSPILQILRPLPPVAVIPLIIIWLGIGEASKIFAISFAVFFPVWIGAHIGAKNVPQTFIWSARTYGIRSFKLAIKIITPAALPFIVSGLRTGAATAFVMVFVSELAGASDGIGYQISVSFLAYRVDRMMAALGELAFFGALTDCILMQGLWLFFPWLKHPTQK